MVTFSEFYESSSQYKPTPETMKDGANLLFRGLLVTNILMRQECAVALSFKRNRFQLDPWSTCERANMIRKRYVLTHIVLENGGKKLRFQTNTDTCGRDLRRVSVENSVLRFS